MWRFRCSIGDSDFWFLPHHHSFNTNEPFCIANEPLGIANESPCMLNTAETISVDHTAWQMLDPIWTPKLRNARPGEYLAGGPPGKSEESTFEIRGSRKIPIFARRRFTKILNPISSKKIPIFVRRGFTKILNPTRDRIHSDFCSFQNALAFRRFPQQIVRQSLLSCLQNLETF